MINIEEIELNENQGVIAKMDDTGDTKIIWSRDNEDEVANARRTFDDLKTKGFTAYSVKKDGEKNEIIARFDPKAERIIMVPAMQGG